MNRRLEYRRLHQMSKVKCYRCSRWTVTRAQGESLSGWDKAANRSSSDIIRSNTSVGREVERRSTRGLVPNNARYGVWFIPEWWLVFFWNWTNFKSMEQSYVSLSTSQAMSMSFASQFNLSTDPWLCGCLCLPCTINKSITALVPRWQMPWTQFRCHFEELVVLPSTEIYPWDDKLPQLLVLR